MSFPPPGGSKVGRRRRSPARRARTWTAGVSALSGRTSVVSNDVDSDPRYLTALESTGSELIVPVLDGGRVVGTLDVEDERTGAFRNDDQQRFEQVARMLTGLYT